METARRVADPATRLRAEASSSPSASVLSASVSVVSFLTSFIPVVQVPTLVVVAPDSVTETVMKKMSITVIQ